MLDLIDITKTFNAHTVNEKVALNKLCLHIDKGDFVTVIGGNGAGKSSMLNAICGSWQIDSGKIVLDGQDITMLNEHKRAKLLGRVFQDPMMGTAPDMQIDENLALAVRRGKRRGLAPGIRKAEHKAFAEMLAGLDLGLENRLTSKVGLLSGGQRQALTLLMATMNNPKLLLLDEHTAALDPKTAQKVLEITEKITKANNQTTIMITHNMKDALAYGNKIVMMNEGQIVFYAQGEEKAKLTVQDLLDRFSAIGQENDRIMLI